MKLDLSGSPKKIRIGIYLAQQFCENADKKNPDLELNVSYMDNFEFDLTSHQQEAFLEFVFSYIHVKFEEKNES